MINRQRGTYCLECLSDKRKDLSEHCQRGAANFFTYFPPLLPSRRRVARLRAEIECYHSLDSNE